MGKKLTTEEFIKRSREKHGDRYNYSLSVYTKSNIKVEIICNIHSSFWQTPSMHMQGQGCALCGAEAAAKINRTGVSEFTTQAEKIHKGKYDYSLVIYKNNSSNAVVICPVHGKFEQTPGAHIAGHGCRKCSFEKQALWQRKSTETFITEAKEVHGLTYDYSKVNYTTAHIKVCIVCPDHGKFEQAPHDHLKGKGCRKCGAVLGPMRKTWTTKRFKKAASLVHKDKYSYSNCKYTGSKTKVNITCSIHEEFLQSPDAHLQGAGCPKCAHHVSSGEMEVVDFVSHYYKTEGSVRNVIKNKELDIFIPELNIAIEYNGNYWHSELKHTNPKWHLLEKKKLCEEKGIRLIHVTEYEDPLIVRKTLSHILGIDKESIYARRCKVLSCRSSNKEITEFFNTNHLQGSVKGCQVFYLTKNNSIVAAMAFSRATSERGNKNSNRWELRRFASVCRVVGGASKLLKAFTRSTPEWKSIISYSESRWFTGEMYSALGFSFIYETGPDYKYFKNRVVLPKGRFKRSSLARRSDIDFNSEESETENANRNGWYRLWDCGKKKWELKNPNL